MKTHPWGKLDEDQIIKPALPLKSYAISFETCRLQFLVCAFSKDEVHNLGLARTIKHRYKFITIDSWSWLLHQLKDDVLAAVGVLCTLSEAFFTYKRIKMKHEITVIEIYQRNISWRSSLLLSPNLSIRLWLQEIVLAQKAPLWFPSKDPVKNIHIYMLLWSNMTWLVLYSVPEGLRKKYAGNIKLWKYKLGFGATYLSSNVKYKS